MSSLRYYTVIASASVPIMSVHECEEEEDDEEDSEWAKWVAALISTAIYFPRHHEFCVCKCILQHLPK